MSKQKHRVQNQKPLNALKTKDRQEPAIHEDLGDQETTEIRGYGSVGSVGGVGSVGSGKQRQENINGTAGLAVLLAYLVTYLSNKVDVDDLDVLSFSLHHLFCCFDSLYRTALPALAASLAPTPDSTGVGETKEVTSAYHPQTWIQLQAMKQTIRRMQPLCQLLNYTGERILGSLGYAKQVANAETSAPDTVDDASDQQFGDTYLQEEANAARRGDEHNEQGLGDTASPESMELVLKDLAAILTGWQQRYRNLPSFKMLLCELFPTIPLSISPDTSFIALLDHASILFGDILPAFQAVSTGDDEAVIMLLFDFLQQTDLMTMQFKSILELLDTLIDQCAAVLMMQ